MRIYNEIDQSIYSRRVVKKDDTTIHFFCSTIGQYDSKGEEVLTRVDTNIHSPYQIHSTLNISAIKFNTWDADKKLRDHLMGYGYFIVRVIDRDYLQYPIHLMDNYFFFMEKKIEVPITIEPHMNFMVQLNITKPYGEDFQMTCELVGKMRRSI